MQLFLPGATRSDEGLALSAVWSVGFCRLVLRLLGPFLGKHAFKLGQGCPRTVHAVCRIPSGEVSISGLEGAFIPPGRLANLLRAAASAAAQPCENCVEPPHLQTSKSPHAPALAVAGICAVQLQVRAHLAQVAKDLGFQAARGGCPGSLSILHRSFQTSIALEARRP